MPLLLRLTARLNLSSPVEPAAVPSAEVIDASTDKHPSEQHWKNYKIFNVGRFSGFSQLGEAWPPNPRTIRHSIPEGGCKPSST